MLATISSRLTGWITHHGVYAVFVLMALDALLPVGGELIMLYAGVVAAGAASGGHTTLLGANLATGTESYTAHLLDDLVVLRTLGATVYVLLLAPGRRLLVGCCTPRATARHSVLTKTARPDEGHTTQRGRRHG